MANPLTPESGVHRRAAVRKYLRARQPGSHHAGKHAEGSGRAANRRHLHPSPSRHFQARLARQVRQTTIQPMTDAEWEQYVLDSPALLPDVEPYTPPDRHSSWYYRYRTFCLVAAFVLIGLLLVFAAVEYANRLREGSEQITQGGCLLLIVAPLVVLGLIAWWFAWRRGSN